MFIFIRICVHVCIHRTKPSPGSNLQNVETIQLKLFWKFFFFSVGHYFDLAVRGYAAVCHSLHVSAFHIMKFLLTLNNLCFWYSIIKYHVTNAVNNAFMSYYNMFLWLSKNACKSRLHYPNIWNLYRHRIFIVGCKVQPEHFVWLFILHCFCFNTPDNSLHFSVVV